ncbi:MAG: PAS domain-containing protein [Alphaproteobacteria bacterium]|nr:PAS domain-containing protein [Alphaproteobacteria bacterium]
MSEDASADKPAEEESERKIPEAPCPIIGIGASAGGIDALRRLIPNVEGGMAFVVVLHLDPDHASVLSEILARCTSLPVIPVEEEVAVESDHIYVISPSTILTIEGGRLRPEQRTGPRGQRNPIDEFLISLANDQGENAACVILSGTGSDGTIGLRAIKEGGGLVLAQAGAEYDGMMRSAVSTGLVDFVLPAEEIPQKLGDYFGRVTRGQDQAVSVDDQLDLAEHLSRITSLLRNQTGHDFSSYKDRTIIRRIQRRMNVLQIEDMGEFVERLRKDSREVALLFQDLLIGVTSFFRDPDAFAALRRDVLPAMIKGKGPDDTVRVWVPGCATGEEAYSIAILLRECITEPHRAPKLQIFASDIDEQALNVARIGRYPATISRDVSPQRLSRFFLREDGTYRVINEIRETCLFSLHNLLRDAPFSKLDLISCRNLLIYLSSDLQDRIIPLFHYALVPAGALFLGMSENVTRHSRLFLTLDKVNRIFQRRAAVERRVPEFPLIAPRSPRHLPLAPSRRTQVGEPSLKAAAERYLVDRFTPAYVVVNQDGELLHSSGRTGKYLELPAGAPDTNLFNMARLGLKLDLRAALHRTISTRQPTVQRKVSIGTNGGALEIDLHVHPLRFDPHSEALYMIVFQDLGAILATETEFTSTEDVGEASVRHLEAELHLTRERLQTTTEELESSNEELKSSNEELQSINEELQSANEELETSKEELQSINEELQTVNSELSSRVEELSRANNDMSNLLESTQIATVFLDRELLVKSFTPAAKDVFWLVESDAGRPIMHVRSRLEGDTLQADAERVLRTLTTIERPVTSAETGHRYMMRMLPYRTVDNVINGVVMTFTDITRISIAEARIEELTHDLRARIDELETILDLVPVGVVIVDGQRGETALVNTYGARLLGEPEHSGLKTTSVGFQLTGEDGAELLPDRHPIERARRGESVLGWQGTLRSDLGGEVAVMMSASPLFAEDHSVRGAVAALVDITRHSQAEAQQQFLLSELQHRVKNILATVASLAMRMARGQGSIEDFREAFLSRLGAMGRTHDLLSSGVWSGASMRSLVLTALEPFAGNKGENILLDGPEIRIASNAASTLGMVFHELATNAAKYGALSGAGGRVEASWRVLSQEGDGQLALTWQEQGGPPLEAGDTAGFGINFITRSVEYELSGSARVELAPGGLRCLLTIPLAGNVEDVS